MAPPPLVRRLELRVRRLEQRVRAARPRARARNVARRTRRAGVLVLHRRPRPGDTDLMRAVRAGDLARVEALLEGGAAVDAHNDRGETALLLATMLGRFDLAACLLAHGADHGLCDARGRAPLSSDVIDVEELHAIRQRYHRYPYPRFDVERAGDPAVERVLTELRASGIVRLPGAVDPATLARMRADFERTIADVEAWRATGAEFRHYDEEMYYWPDDLAYISNNAFKHSAALARFCCSSPIVDVARLYIGKPAYIQRAVAMRYLPADVREHEMFRFHHDIVERRLKVMVLLTDVGAGDQHMSYVKGTHDLYHPYEMFFANACPTSYCEQRLGRVDVFTTTGQAGDVFLFDSNGAHCGTRRATGRLRDAYFVEFIGNGIPQIGGDIPPEVFDDDPLTETHPLYVMANAPKRWELPITRGPVPRWMMNLQKPEQWTWSPGPGKLDGLREHATSS
jgi:hypothetical protein